MRTPFDDDFLRSLPEDSYIHLDKLLEKWDLNKPTFHRTLDAWFDNFQEDQKPTALRALFALSYVSEDEYHVRLDRRKQAIDAVLSKANSRGTPPLIITAPGQADSSQLHAYFITKRWRLPTENVISLDNLSKTHESDCPIILFNDTHGSANQFFRDVLPLLRKIHLFNTRPIVIAAIFIARQAQKRFSELPPNIHILPRSAAPSVFDKHTDLTPQDIDTITILGNSLCPKHPLGYGDCGLLVSYFFQCPNNSLPIFWAGGPHSEDCTYWNPLFPYQPKTTIRHSEKRPLREATPAITSPTAPENADSRDHSPRPSRILIPQVQLTRGGSLLQHDLLQICQVLRNGGVAILPSDTCYSIAALPHYSNTIAEARSLFPNREHEPISLAFASPEMLERFVHISNVNRHILIELTPGPMTLVAPVKTAFEERMRPVANVTTNTLGVRLPDSIIERQVSQALGMPITTYAIRFSGHLARYYADAHDYIATVLQDRDPEHAIEVIGVRGSSPQYHSHSTVVETLPRKQAGHILNIIRDGDIDRERIEKIVRIIEGIEFQREFATSSQEP